MIDLDIKRLFSPPPLSGRVPTRPAFAPDGAHLAYLLPAEVDHTRLELWVADSADGRSRPIQLGLAETPDAAERDRRERLRIFSHGVVDYAWHPDGRKLWVPMGRTSWLVGLEDDAAALDWGAPVSHTQLSPTGDRAAGIIEQNLAIMDLASHAVRRLTADGGGPVSNGLPEFIAQEEMHRYQGFWFAPDGQRIAFLRVDESPIPESLRYEIDAGEIRMVAQRYPYAGGANAEVRLCIVDLDGGVQQLWAPASERYVARVCWTPDGKALLVEEQSRDQKTLRLLRIDAATGSETLLLREESSTWINLFDDPVFADAERLLWLSERSGSAQLYELTPTGLRQVTRDVGCIDRVLVAAGRDAFYLGWRDHPTERHLFRVDLDTGASEPLTETPGWHDAGVHPPSGRRFDLFSSVTQPPMLTIEDDAGTRIVRANDPADPAHPLAAYWPPCPTRFIELCADDGQPLHARLTEPAGFDRSRRWPVVIQVYGGPGVQRVTNAWQFGWTQYLARRGYAVFELDNRGSARRGRDFEAPIHGRLGDVELRDQLAGVAWLYAEPWVDHERLAIYGHSYGGFMALMALARSQSVFRAAIAVAPVTTWRLYDTHYTERYLGHPDDNPEGYRDSDVFTWLDGLAESGGELLLIHGMADDNVLFTHSTRLMKALQDRGIPFDLMTYPGAKHGLAEPPVAIHRFEHMTRFLERALR